MGIWISREKLGQGLYSCYVVFLISFISMYFPISSMISLTYWLFKSLLLNFHIFVDFSFLSHQCLVSFHCGQKKYLYISVFFNVLRLALWAYIWLSWRMLHVHLRRICILLFLDGMFCTYRLSSSGLMCHLKLMFLCWFFAWMITHWCKWWVLKYPIITVLMLISVCKQQLKSALWRLLGTFLYFPSLCCSSHCVHLFLYLVLWAS